MLTKIQSLVLAENFINALQNNEKSQDLIGRIECYQNGREHGFIIWLTFGKCNKHKVKIGGKEIEVEDDKAYYICQHRNSDSLTIYVGPYSMQSISEEAYRNPHSFSPEFANTVGVEWIIEEIKKDNASKNQDS